MDGQNIALEFRFANNALDRLPALAAELVGNRPDVIFTFTSGGAMAAASATSTIPIVVGPVIEGDYDWACQILLIRLATSQALR